MLHLSAAAYPVLQQRLDMLPPGIGRAVDQRELLSQRLDSVSVLIVRVHGMDTLWSVSTPQVGIYARRYRHTLVGCTLIRIFTLN